MAFDGSNFGEAIHGVARWVEGSGSDYAPTSQCGGCGIRIAQGKLVCEVCKAIASLDTENRITKQAGEMIQSSWPYKSVAKDANRERGEAFKQWLKERGME